MTYLSKQAAFRLDLVTVIYLVDRWVVRVKLKGCLCAQQGGDFLAFLNENGMPFDPTPRLADAFDSLDLGVGVAEVMERHHLVIISHGVPRSADLTEFRTKFVQKLGYCPPSLV